MSSICRRGNVRKLIQGIVEFHKSRRDLVKDTFARLALGQKPDAFLIACSDSRVAVNVFASTDPGDVFVVRNAGNLVTPYDASLSPHSDESEVAALEFALQILAVRHIVVCGHSDCGAVKALCGGRDKVTTPALGNWLRHGEQACERVRRAGRSLVSAEDRDEVSRQNTLLQLEHLTTYPEVARRLQSGGLMLHGLWFDIRNSDVYYANLLDRTFRILDDEEGAKVLSGLC